MIVRLISFISALIVVISASSASAALLVDFNSTTQDDGPNNNSGYQAYNAGHESAADLGQNTTPGNTAVYSTTFAITGTTNVSLTPDWTNTTNVAVRQSIDRTSTFDATWTDTDLDLVTDFLGSDTRTGSGGNGDWDGTTGTPTYLTLTLANLPAADCDWRSYHHDTENVHGDFAVWIDTGSGFVQLADGSITDGTAGGNPDSGNTVSDFAGMATNGSIYDTSFTADGSNDVVFRFAPYANTEVHRRIFVINGFELTQVPEPSSALLALLGMTVVLRRRR